MQIPFIDLRAQYEPIKQELDTRLKKSLDSFQFCKGKEVSDFETEFANLLSTKNCITTGNGTDALFLSLKALDAGNLDEVITPAFSWISSAETISLCGATPVFADVHPQTYTLDPNRIEEKITSKTKIIIAVHLYGQMAQIEDIQRICKNHHLYLIEDCAQAHLSQDRGQYAGTFGDLGAFSFYPTKNLGGFGDAGCVITPHDELAQKIRRLSNHGALDKDDHLIEGMNSRMDTLQAAVLLSKLPHLKKWNLQREKNARLYSRILQNIPQITIPFIRENTRHTFHLYVIKAHQRTELKNFLHDHGVQTMIHYPKALPNLPAYNHLKLDTITQFPVSHALQDAVLSLPIYPELKEEAIEYIGEKIKDFYKSY